MLPDYAVRLAEIVEAALDRDPQEWPSFLEHSCGDDVALRHEVESLLSRRPEAADFIEAPAYQSAAGLLVTDVDELKPGDKVGDYQIVSLLGEGGMGEVYLAEDAQLGRQVALKLVKRGFGGADLVRHFRRVK